MRLIKAKVQSGFVKRSWTQVTAFCIAFTTTSILNGCSKSSSLEKDTKSIEAKPISLETKAVNEFDLKKPKETNTHKYTNRLAKEPSPYLQHHKHNPVDWYPWGDEAFKKAKA